MSGVRAGLSLGAAVVFHGAAALALGALPGSDTGAPDPQRLTWLAIAAPAEADTDDDTRAGGAADASPEEAAEPERAAAPKPKPARKRRVRPTRVARTKPAPQPDTATVDTHEAKALTADAQTDDAALASAVTAADADAAAAGEHATADGTDDDTAMAAGGGQAGRGAGQGSGAGQGQGHGTGLVAPTAPRLVARSASCTGYFPSAADADHGRVQIALRVDPEGHALPAQILLEAPHGQGFARAAIACTARLRFVPARDDHGLATTAEARVELRFDRQHAAVLPPALDTTPEA